MKLVLAGTKDSREVIRTLKSLNEAVIASVTTDYGYQLFSQLGVEVIQTSFTKDSLKDLIITKEIGEVIDATHPFAVEISTLASQVCSEIGIDYLYFQRQSYQEEINSKYQKAVIPVNDFKAAVKKAEEFKKIFLTIGSKHLEVFKQGITNWQQRLIARILPRQRFLARAEKMGFTASNLIGLQGPCSKNLNKAILKDYQIDVLVTKASGKQGGLDNKLQAAYELGVAVILINRPKPPKAKIVSSQEELRLEIVVDD